MGTSISPDTVQLLRAAYVIAKAAEPKIPDELFGTFENKGKPATPVCTRKDTKQTVEALKQLIDWIDTGPNELNTDEPVVEAAADAADLIGARLLGQIAATLQRQSPAYAYMSALWTVGAVLADDYGYDPEDRTTVWTYLKTAVIHANNSGIDIKAELGNLYGIQAENWPIFLRLLDDGRPLPQAAEAAHLI